MGDTMQVAPVVPAQVPPFQVYEVAAGVQSAVRVAEPPAVIVPGEAVRVHTGACGGGAAATVMLCETWGAAL